MEIFTQLALNSLIAGATYSLVALGFNLVFGTTRFLNMGHGAVASVGGYMVLALARNGHLPFTVSVFLAVLAAGLLGWLIDRLVYAPLRTRRASSSVLVITSLGVLIVLQSLLAIIFTSQFWTLAAPSVWFATVFSIGSGNITGLQLTLILASVLIFSGGWLVLRFSDFGKQVRAVGDDEEVARIIGVPSERVIGGTVFWGSAVAGLAGVLVGLDTGVYPTMGLLLLLSAATASIIGGLGSVTGALLGAYLLGFVENFGIWFIPSGWKTAISFGVLVIFLLFRPHGILNKEK
ncbi:MAG: branched-chain amino acid ABC transporter permease [Candidatus Liptonbacteria bacterium]|nr:branched-chain amino acid ABC transporter permease [Candidatus Liptonbacteria bacterium]